MNITTELFPIDQIDLQQRARYAETEEAQEKLEDLCDSIQCYGLLQPILIDQHNVLLAGWRRFSACQRLGWKTIPVHRRERLSDSEYLEIEREENFQRLGFTWQEEVLLACRIHRAHVRQSALKGEKWSNSMTGDLIGYSRQYVDNCFTLEPLLAKNHHNLWIDPEIGNCDGITDAIRTVLRRREDEALKESARRMGLTKATAPIIQDNTIIDTTPLQSDAAADNLIGDLLGDIHSKEVIPEQTIDLSHTFFHGDCVDILTLWPEACVDHIITDPPYGIEMDNLDQSSTSMMDTSRVDETHDVDANLSMFPPMLRSLYHVLKPGGYCILWCDIMNWQLLYDNAITTGFKVQRWPFTWCKLHQCKNQMAHVNFTKNTEIAMVLRKGIANLPTPVQSSYILAAKEPHLSNPFAKPFVVWRQLVEAVSIPGQTILEPFAGEGSGVLSFMKCNRRVLAIEKDEKHYNVLLNEVRNHWTTIFKNVKFI